MPLRNGFRVSKIEIDLPKQGEMPFVRLLLERIGVNEANEIVEVSPVVDQIIVSAAEIGQLEVTVGAVTVNGFEAQEIVRQLAIALVNQKHGTVFDPNVGDTGKAMFP